MHKVKTYKSNASTGFKTNDIDFSVKNTQLPLQFGVLAYIADSIGKNRPGLSKKYTKTRIPKKRISDSQSIRNRKEIFEINNKKSKTSSNKPKIKINDKISNSSIKTENYVITEPVILITLLMKEKRRDRVENIRIIAKPKRDEFLNHICYYFIKEGQNCEADISIEPGNITRASIKSSIGGVESLKTFNTKDKSLVDYSIEFLDSKDKINNENLINLSKVDSNVDNQNKNTIKKNSSVLNNYETKLKSLSNLIKLFKSSKENKSNITEEINTRKEDTDWHILADNIAKNESSDTNSEVSLNSIKRGTSSNSFSITFTNKENSSHTSLNSKMKNESIDTNTSTLLINSSINSNSNSLINTENKENWEDSKKKSESSNQNNETLLLGEEFRISSDSNRVSLDNNFNKDWSSETNQDSKNKSENSDVSKKDSLVDKEMSSSFDSNPVIPDKDSVETNQDSKKKKESSDASNEASLTANKRSKSFNSFSITSTNEENSSHSKMKNDSINSDSISLITTDKENSTETNQQDNKNKNESFDSNPLTINDNFNKENSSDTYHDESSYNADAIGLNNPIIHPNPELKNIIPFLDMSTSLETVNKPSSESLKSGSHKEEIKKSSSDININISLEIVSPLDQTSNEQDKNKNDAILDAIDKLSKLTEKLENLLENSAHKNKTNSIENFIKQKNENTEMPDYNSIYFMFKKRIEAILEDT